MDEIKPAVCIICGKPLEGNRKETCSDTCRSRLHRLRKKGKAAKDSLTAADLEWLSYLEKNVPTAAFELYRLRAVYGKEAFDMALSGVRESFAFFQAAHTQATA